MPGQARSSGGSSPPAASGCRAARARPEIAEALTAFLAGDGLDVEDQALVVGALDVMARANVSYVDAYLAESARRAHEPVASFDRSFARLNVEWIEPA
ncbi:MAG: PIN domain-containing protein [Tepidiformaceae bacterium]